MVAPSDLRFEGRDACVGYAMAWLNAFPDAQINVRNRRLGAVDRNGVHVRGHTPGDPRGPGGEIPATGKQLVGRGAEIVRVENGKAAEFQLYFDQVQVLTQLGLMPEPATA